MPFPSGLGVEKCIAEIKRRGIEAEILNQDEDISLQLYNCDGPYLNGRDMLASVVLDPAKEQLLAQVLKSEDGLSQNQSDLDTVS